MTLRDVKLPSGATLKIQAGRFADSKTLLNAVSAEFRTFKIRVAEMDMADVYKELACIGLSSLAVEKAFWACTAGCLYVPAESEVPLKLTPDVFEPVDRRDDYITVLMEVARDNIGPFMRRLYALWSAAQEAASASDQKSEPSTMTSSSTSDSAATGMLAR